MVTIKKVIGPADDTKYTGKCNCPSCLDPETGKALYPQYGVGPHTCFYKIPGATVGGSKPLPKEEWPSNYVEDSDCPGTGMWYCPDCGNGITPVEIAVS